jgi:pimeloyl-ACP methyl ester carboxylesterase
MIMNLDAATPRAVAWRQRGGYFSWRPEKSDASAVDVFHIEVGDPNLPVLLLVHGFPTSSIDWFDIAERLSRSFRVCALDFPGYGFSGKPPGWGYSIPRDAELLGFYLSEVLNAQSAVVLAHDRGDSVALVHAARCAEGTCPVGLEHLMLTNANLFLPLSNLAESQRLMLHESTAPQVLREMTPDAVAQFMGAAAFTPARSSGDPEIEAIASTLAHDNGVAVLHETIQYLVERSADEQSWLEALAASATPTTVIWGMNDTVAPPRVATFVWDRYMMLKPGRNSLYLVPDANHYLQNDRPDALAGAVFHALDPAGQTTPGAITAEPGSPVLIDCSRAALPTAAEVLTGPKA